MTPKNPSKSSIFALFFEIFELLRMAGLKVGGRRGPKHKLALPIPQVYFQKIFYDDLKRIVDFVLVLRTPPKTWVLGGMGGGGSL